MSDTLSLTRPDDWHVHLRDGDALGITVPASAAIFERCIVMPNLDPPVTTTEEALAYRSRILKALPEGAAFQPLMTLYLTDRTSPEEIARAAASEAVFACKLYPSGATTNSDRGVTRIEGISHVLEALEEARLPLLIHGEATAPEIDVFDREKVFVESTLTTLVERFQNLRVVLEHITTSEAADFVRDARAGVAATITPQHLLMNRGDLFDGGLRPHNYCLPVLKRRTHQEVLRRVATSGNPRFFLGTDSAPHARHSKERDCGCAGCYSAPAALQLYAQVFEQENALDRLEGFASHFGADFYGLPRNQSQITLERKSWRVPARLDYPGQDGIVPYWAGRELDWSIRS